MMFAISLGRGKTRPFAAERAIHSTASSLAKEIEAHQGEEAWWSPSVWLHCRRSQENWLGASVVAVDIDFRDDGGKHARIPDDVRDAALDALTALPVSLHHATPRGLRAVFLLDRPIEDHATFEAAATAANRAVGAALAAWAPHLEVDEPVTGDRARLLYTPRATVDGNERSADVRVVVEQPMALEALLELGRAARTRLPAPPPPPAAPPAQAVEASDPAIGALLAGERASSQAKAVAARRDAPQGATAVATRRPLPSLPEAVEAWNRDHAQAYPKGGTGDCPMCGHRGCFGTSGDDPNRWSCFSTDHGRATGGKGGRQGNGRWFGDQLDIEAHRTGRSRHDLLAEAGYLEDPKDRRRREGINLLKSLPRNRAFDDFRAFCRTGSARLTPEQIAEEFADAETWAQIAEALSGSPAPAELGTPAGSAGAAGSAKSEVTSAAPAPAEVAASASRADDRARAAPAVRRLRCYSEEEILARPPVEWLVDGYLPKVGLSVMCGPPGCGKSFVLIDIAKRVVRGMPWCGREVERGAAALFVGEGSGGLGQRFQAWKVGNPDAPSDSAGLWTFEETPSILQEQAIYLNELRDLHRRQSLALIAIDTLSRAISGENENATEVMSEAVAFCTALVREFQCCVLLVHHERKSATGKKEAPDLNAMRGSGSLGGGLESALAVWNEAGLVTIATTKQKDGKELPPVMVILEEVPVAPDAKGRPRTAPYVRHKPPREIAMERAVRRDDELLGRLRALYGQVSWPCNQGTLVKHLCARGVKRKKAREVIEEALAAGLLALSTGGKTCAQMHQPTDRLAALLGAREGGELGEASS